MSEDTIEKQYIDLLAKYVALQMIKDGLEKQNKGLAAENDLLRRTRMRSFCFSRN